MESDFKGSHPSGRDRQKNGKFQGRGSLTDGSTRAPGAQKAFLGSACADKGALPCPYSHQSPSHWPTAFSRSQAIKGLLNKEKVQGKPKVAPAWPEHFAN